MKARWDNPHAAWDANDLLHLLWTWQQGDVCDYGGEDLADALQVVKSQCLIMPSRTDNYFPPEDSMEEVKLLGEKGRLSVIESIHGHLAGTGAGTEADTKFLMDEIGNFVKQLA